MQPKKRFDVDALLRETGDKQMTPYPDPRDPNHPKLSDERKQLDNVFNSDVEDFMFLRDTQMPQIVMGKAMSDRVWFRDMFMAQPCECHPDRSRTAAVIALSTMTEVQFLSMAKDIERTSGREVAIRFIKQSYLQKAADILKEWYPEVKFNLKFQD